MKDEFLKISSGGRESVTQLLIYPLYFSKSLNILLNFFEFSIGNFNSIVKFSKSGFSQSL
ncbi:hypothetical protein SAMN05444412_102258 [Rhodonellum ikkaensis]|uniref:Uncharacterized protein n=1 Tax=Rhodonellum ikkaensis TaxID=336829 RepID=A0A1H3LYW3_9BACT|nr:hypothetical protein SAMN05444412_102258 [Rhodonellum ikkaensis]